MAEVDAPNVVVNICHNSVPEQGHLSRQWVQDGVRVLVREVPCSGKIDGQYLLHAIEGVTHGICVVACLKGHCRLAQGNLRAGVRMRTIQRLLGEIGLEPERAVLLAGAEDASAQDLERRIQETVQALIRLGPSALHKSSPSSAVREADRHPLSDGAVAAAAIEWR